LTAFVQMATKIRRLARNSRLGGDGATISFGNLDELPAAI
jgi:hypothetical protein